MAEDDRASCYATMIDWRFALYDGRARLEVAIPRHLEDFHRRKRIERYLYDYRHRVYAADIGALQLVVAMRAPMTHHLPPFERA